MFLVALVLAWRWRTWREAVQREKQMDNRPAANPTDIVACRQCGVHVPIQDAVSGDLGAYCTTRHRADMEP